MKPGPLWYAVDATHFQQLGEADIQAVIDLYRRPQTVFGTCA